ncbi:MAG: UDP-N-acetylmuramoyl-L-alanyl-D-glutamate--2,6-diaminopimelate ligase [Pseudomonadales bacterium]
MISAMSLRELLADFAPALDEAATGRGITGITEDSRQVTAGGLFVAVQGAAADGHAHAQAAVARGAAAVVAERPIAGLAVPVVVVPELRARRGALAARFYRHPGERLFCVGVTGTNGKTSIAHYLADLASRLERPAGYLGTIGWGRIDQLQPARLTTEDPITVQQRLASLVEQGCRWAVLEVSSHALAQERVSDVPFRAAVFSNLSRDHLDYHQSLEQYAAAKARLFQWPGLELAVLNVDDPFGLELSRTLPAGAQCLSYGRGAGRSGAAPDVCWSGLDFSSGVAAGVWHTPWGEAPLCLPVQAEFSVANMAAALALLCHSGVALDDVVAAARSLRSVPGRMERFSAPGAATLVVDFAHTPDALEQALLALRPATRGKLVCVFGCGGDRDTGKRPLMAAAAERHADELWLTSDNPRSEDPLDIIADMRAGLSGLAAARTCADRRDAIAGALAAAGPGDVVLVAGKGHEDYQEIRGERRPFSDRALAAELLGGAR